MKQIDCDTIRQLDLLEPFGEANRKPIFAFKNLKIDSIRSLSDGKHLKMTLKDENTLVDAIGFNSFNGRDSVQVNIKDVMKSF